MKKFLSVLLMAVFVISFVGCDKADNSKSDKIQIVTTVFPMYDFARNIAGDKAEVTLLLPAGAEAHSYEPAVQDVVRIHECDLFIRLGKGAEPWTESIVNEKGENGRVISAMECVNIKEEEHHHEHSDFEYDQHIWTSLRNSKEIVLIIAQELGKADSENAAFYMKNAEEYVKQLDELDSRFAKLTKDCSKTLVFADRFPFRYFTDDYNLECFAAYPGCSDESEPSAATVAQLMEKVKNNNIQVVFYTETSGGQLPDTVCEETGAKKMLFHSCHTLTKSELDAGKNYISLMEDNYNALKAYLQ